MRYTYIFTVLFFLVSITSYAQQGVVHGVILDQAQRPIPGVSVSISNEVSVSSDQNGFYQLKLDASEEIFIRYSKPEYKSSVLQVSLRANQIKELHVLMLLELETLNEITIIKDSYIRDGGIVIAPELLRKIPGAQNGVENILKSLPGVNSNSELSSQYSVRGGSFDENLIYVNGIEVYRPFLIRSGQQEGLSFINSDMVDNISFSSGGFQAKYGDKLSSVLDITYRTPAVSQASIQASFLGASATVDLVSKNKKWTNISGIRYRDNKMLVSNSEQQGMYKPSFLDFQTLISFKSSPKWNWSFLGTLGENTYDNSPNSRQTNFGTVQDPMTLMVHYRGREIDTYKTLFASINGTFKYSDNTEFTLVTGAYHAKEQEYYDIQASYFLGETESNLASDTFGEIKYVKGIGSQLNHARNNYDALMINAELKAMHRLEVGEIQWGVKYGREDVRDRMVEWEIIDSAGYVLPGTSGIEQGSLLPTYHIRSNNSPVISRLQVYGQYNRKISLNQAEAWLNLGLRGHYWNIGKVQSQASSGQFIISPRIQFSVKPLWEKDMVFRLAMGLYQQPPSYREFRSWEGTLNPDLKAQKSVHLVLGHDYVFSMWDKAFKLSSELYYKRLTDVNSFTVDNIRVRYRADNLAEASVYGAEMRLNGMFVPGVDSWLSLGVMKAQENYNDQGVISRPTDQRFKVGLLFQDYMPSIPNFKLYLNLVYNTGLPGGSPSYADPYDYKLRLKDYKRVDLGFSYVFKDAELGQDKKWLNKVKELALGFEIYNLFNNKNAITNTWVRDVYSKNQYGIPNYMTDRTFNLKFNLKF